MALHCEGQRHVPPDSAQLGLTPEDWYDRVARKVTERYQQRGEQTGHVLDEWLLAERLIADELCHHSPI